MEDKIISDKSDKKIIITCVLLALTMFAIDSLIPLGVAGGVPYILVILISFRPNRKKLALYMAIGTSILTFIGFFSSPAGGELWKVLTNRSLALFAIWTVAVLSVQRKTIFDEKEEALSKVKVLNGFLPICATCKKIRDDQGYWNQIESYIKDHSEADFSHGICPECAKQVLMEFKINNNQKRDMNAINPETSRGTDYAKR